MRDRKKIGKYLLMGVLVCGAFVGYSNQQAGQKKSIQNRTQTETEASAVAERDIFAMDTYMTVTAYGDRAEEAIDAVEKEINRLDCLLSTQNPKSEIYIVNENGSKLLSDDTAVLIEKSLELHDSTKGLFDITVYPLMQEWGFTTGKYQVPEKRRLEKLLQCVGMSQIEYDSSKQLLKLPEGVKIDLGGIAKGYTSERVMEIFKEYGIKSGIVSLGGNVQTYGAKTDGSLWRVAIRNPDTSSEAADYIGVLETKDKAVITSGGYERYFEQNGKSYHHILNPQTGFPAESGLDSVTVVSGDGTLADGLSTSLFIMGKEKALEYWRSQADTFDMVLVEDNGTVTISEGIKEDFSTENDVVVEYR